MGDGGGVAAEVAVMEVETWWRLVCSLEGGRNRPVTASKSGGEEEGICNSSTYGTKIKKTTLYVRALDGFEAKVPQRAAPGKTEKGRSSYLCFPALNQMKGRAQTCGDEGGCGDSGVMMLVVACVGVGDGEMRGNDVGGGVRWWLVMGRWYGYDDEGGGGCDGWPEAVEGGDEVEMV
nr:hypothetical protein [Tanacetum cinerariifolium]